MINDVHGRLLQKPLCAIKMITTSKRFVPKTTTSIASEIRLQKYKSEQEFSFFFESEENEKIKSILNGIPTLNEWNPKYFAYNPTRICTKTALHKG